MSIDQLSLKKLVSLAFSRNVSCPNFVLLYTQLNSKLEIPNNDYVTNLVEAYESKSKTYRNETYLAYSIAVSFIDESSLNKFWTSLIQCSISLQISYLKKLPDFLISHKINGNVVSLDSFDLFVNKYLFDYTLETIKSINKAQSETLSADMDHLLSTIVLLWCFLIERYEQHIKVQHLEMASRPLLNSLAKYKKNSLRNYFVHKIRKPFDTFSAQISNDKSTNQTNKHSPNVKSIFDSPKGAIKSSKLIGVQKYIWFDCQLKKWKLHLKPEQILKLYEAKFYKQFPETDVKKNYILFYELLAISLKGNLTAISRNEAKYVSSVWQIFLLSVVPQCAKILKLSNLGISDSKRETIQDAIVEVFNNFNEEKLSHIKISFLESCLYNEIIDESLIGILKIIEFNKDYMNIGSISEQFQSKLIEIRSEFTSLEESGFVEFINAISKSTVQYSLCQQTELAENFCKIIDKLIADKDNEKLSRLLLTVLNNSYCITIIAFHCNEGPLTILNKLTTYIDSEEFVTEDNFQETYGHFGSILMSSLLICIYFRIDFTNAYVKKSYSYDYFNNYSFRLNELLGSSVLPKTDEDKTIIQNYNSLISDWINGLFDDSQDGLSDDLIKSVDVKQIYKIIPTIYQQAIVACETGKIDEKILNNGFDYLTQFFLIPCCHSILTWVLSHIWIESNPHKQMHNDETLQVKIIHELLKSILNSDSVDEGHNESALMVKLVLSCCGNQILYSLKQLKSWENSTKIKEIIQMITNNIDDRYIDEVNYEFVGNNDTNFVEVARNHLVELVENHESNQIHYNFKLINFILQNQQKELITLIREEIENYMKHSNVHDLESDRMFLNLIVFIIVHSEGDENREYWINLFKGNLSETKKSTLNTELSFSTSMSYHYSSIFNVSEDNADEDLFNEHFNFDNRKSPITTNVNSILRRSSFFAHLYKTLQQTLPKTMVSSLNSFKEKLVEELENDRSLQFVT